MAKNNGAPSGAQKLAVRFVEHNTDKGRKASGRAGSWWYRGSVMYYSRTPIARIILRDGLPVLVRKNYPWAFKLVRIPDIETPDLGVFSVHVDDMLTDPAAVHERVRFIFLSMAAEFFDEKVAGHDGNHWSKERNVRMMRSGIEGIYGQHEKYSTFFGLKWRPIPALFMQRCEEEVERVLKNFRDPKNVEARARAAARRQAKLALVGRKK